MRADLGELVRAGIAAHDDPVAELHVPGQRGVVSHDAVAADAAVVRDVREGHEQVVAADGGDAAAVRGAAIHGGELAEHVAIADLEARGLALVLEILRRITDGRELEDLVAGADGGGAVDDRVRTDPGARADGARRRR